MGHCQICGWYKKLTKQGVLVKHGGYCEGSHQQPLEADRTLFDVKFRTALSADSTLFTSSHQAETRWFVNVLIQAQPNETQDELRRAQAWVEEVLRGISNLCWFFQAAEKYSRCRVCGGPVPEALRAHAFRTYQQECCSTKCCKREIIQRYACCEKADFSPCVCMYSFKCPEHGERHIGTHD